VLATATTADGDAPTADELATAATAESKRATMPATEDAAKRTRRMCACHAQAALAARTLPDVGGSEGGEGAGDVATDNGTSDNFVVRSAVRVQSPGVCGLVECVTSRTRLCGDKVGDVHDDVARPGGPRAQDAMEAKMAGEHGTGRVDGVHSFIAVHEGAAASTTRCCPRRFPTAQP
jgi:hypothetical protein